MNSNLKDLLEKWGKKRENWSEYEKQLNYYKKIRENIPEIVEYWKNLDQNKKEKLKNWPVSYYFWRAKAERYIDLGTLETLNEQMHKDDPKKGDYKYIEYAKEKLDIHIQNKNILEEWKKEYDSLDKKGDYFVDANKEYYSDLIDDAMLKNILDQIRKVLNVNSTRSSIGADKKSITQGKGLYNLFEMFRFIHENKLEEFERKVEEVPFLNVIAKEVFGFFNLGKGSFIFTSRQRKFFSEFYNIKKVNKASDIKSVFEKLRDYYKNYFSKNLNITKIENSLKGINLSKSELENIQLNLQIDQLIYFWDQEINKSQKVSSTNSHKSKTNTNSTEKKLEYPSIREQNFRFSSKLYFENRDKLEKMISNAIMQGKHIILIGPPGTGKSKMAKEICKYYVDKEENYTMTTAISEWSTFDTIGGYLPKENGCLEFKPGIILKCFRDGDKIINKWLIIDEINRTDIDKAFGSLFSALTGDDIEISFEVGNKPIKVLGKPDSNKEYALHEFPIHQDWRIIATMNSLDKASLYEMSYAFMRRFAFVPVQIPNEISETTIDKYLDCWKDHDGKKLDLGPDHKIRLAKIWSIFLEHNIQIGPSIIEDIVRYIHNDGTYSHAIAIFILPQLEGTTEKCVRELLEELKQNGINDLEKDFSNFLGFKTIE